MIPAWVWSVVVVAIGSVAALWLGSFLPDLDPFAALELVFVAAACVGCAAYSNFPFLLALGAWIPFFPHILGPASTPTIAYVLLWIAAVLFFRLCMQGYISYRKSFSWYLLIAFAWVPIRFLMNPVTKLGATAGGSGVSGAMPYFLYVMAAGILILLGAILTDRDKLTYFMRWSFVVALVSGIVLAICAFIPATGPYLIALGTFSAGNISDGIQRLVVLPGYGLFIAEAALCPALFRMKRWQCLITFAVGIFMIVLGGNRSAIAALILVVPIILFLRRRSNSMFVSLVFMGIALGAVRYVSASLPADDIPPLMRSLGVFDSKIDEASGGDASAKWRYAVWQDGWQKIMETPMTGKGFGNLPLHVETTQARESTDFEMVLAGGESHNGFVTAAYGFGIPFMAALSLAMIYYFIKESALALTNDKSDQEMQDLHAFLAAMFASYPLLIYTAFDLSSSNLWIYIAMSCILSNLPRKTKAPVESVDAGVPVRTYGNQPRPAGAFSYRPR